MEKLYFGGLLFLLVLFFTASYIFLTQSPQTEKGVFPGTIHFATIDFPGYAALYIAREKGFFQEKGLDVALDKFDSISELTQAFVNSNNIHGRTNLAFNVVQEAYQGIDQKIVLIIDYSIGADAIIAREDVQTLTDLAGKRILIDQDSFQTYFLYHALKDVLVSLDDVELISRSSTDDAIELLEKGEIDAMVVFEPELSEFLRQPTIHQLVSSKEYPSNIIDVMTFKSDFIDAYPITVQLFIDAYLESVDFLKNNPEESAQILANELNISLSDAKDQLSGVKILDFSDNENAFRPGYNTFSLFSRLYDIKSFLLQFLKYRLFVNTDTLIDPTFIRIENI